MNYNIDNKELLMRAIEQHDTLNSNQKKILKILATLEDKTPVNTLVTISNLSKQIVYPALNKLHKMQFVLKSKCDTPVVYTFQINKAKVYDDILDFFIKKQNVIKNLD